MDQKSQGSGCKEKLPASQLTLVQTRLYTCIQAEGHAPMVKTRQVGCAQLCALLGCVLRQAVGSCVPIRAVSNTGRAQLYGLSGLYFLIYLLKFMVALPQLVVVKLEKILRCLKTFLTLF